MKDNGTPSKIPHLDRIGAGLDGETGVFPSYFTSFLVCLVITEGRASRCDM